MGRGGTAQLFNTYAHAVQIRGYIEPMYGIGMKNRSRRHQGDV